MEEESWKKQEEEGTVEIRVTNGVQHRHWWWYGASAAQIGLGIRSVRKGNNSVSSVMAFKALGIATLFVGAFATTILGTFSASGINKVEDMKELISSIRTAIRAPAKKPSE